MKYSVHVDINRPIKHVVALFDDPDNMYKWMRGLKEIEHLEGEPGKAGAKSKLTFVIGKRDVEMIEVIEKRNLPEEFVGVYEAGQVVNRVSNRFEATGGSSTRYTSDVEFRFGSLSMKVMGWLMPGAFKKQTLQFLNDFKDFAERERN